MNDETNQTCPKCGEVGTIAVNLREAWCLLCDFWVTARNQPEEFAKLRAMVLAHREEVGGFFDEMLKQSNR